MVKAKSSRFPKPKTSLSFLCTASYHFQHTRVQCRPLTLKVIFVILHPICLSAVSLLSTMLTEADYIRSHVKPADSICIVTGTQARVQGLPCTNHYLNSTLPADLE